ncbi:heterokaryon incompatibility protein-domain-containing protein [Bisporella sp. PMI_857]|nr:heterokaryon incompatibility protein-domain-containing protein [Bisporella sp. PMI_857]
MRLLCTSIPYRVQEFVGDTIPSYAILSHRWEQEEVLFQDVMDLGADHTTPMSKLGWTKLVNFCERAARDGYHWAWMDTCCIDKSSSAELSEAINSMFNYYRRAGMCYAFLTDIPSGNLSALPLNTSSESILGASKWFTRGWTLQELLAPQEVTFFDCEWGEIGTRSSLETVISAVTGIHDLEAFENASCAQKFSWASRRETTRLEDRAYSLLGLFGVSLSPIYGEGCNAFRRLQLEILRDSDDESIFAWTDSENMTGGLLAHSPTAFQYAGNIRQLEFDTDKPPYSMTNKGLFMRTSYTYPINDPETHVQPTPKCLLMPLQCSSSGTNLPHCIYVRQMNGNQYARIAAGSLPLLSEDLYDRIIRKHAVDELAIYFKQRKENECPFNQSCSVSIYVDGLHGTVPTTNRFFSQASRVQCENYDNSNFVLTFDKVYGNVLALLHFWIPRSRAKRMVLSIFSMRRSFRVTLLKGDEGSAAQFWKSILKQPYEESIHRERVLEFKAMHPRNHVGMFDARRFMVASWQDTTSSWLIRLCNDQPGNALVCYELDKRSGIQKTVQFL